ncbi:MAG: hypothetical protein V3V38_00440 [Nitrosopumilaceae archaeon]
MNIIFEVSTTNYDKDIEFVTNALEDLQKLCETENGYKFSKPVSRFGWTFFKLWITPNLHLKIDAEFSDMIKKAKGRKQNEKFTNFMSDFFASKECSVKLKITEED